MFNNNLVSYIFVVFIAKVFIVEALPGGFPNDSDISSFIRYWAEAEKIRANLFPSFKLIRET